MNTNIIFLIIISFFSLYNINLQANVNATNKQSTCIKCKKDYDCTEFFSGPTTCNLNGCCELT